MAVLLKILFLLFIVYAGLCIGLFLRQDSILFQPYKWDKGLATPKDVGIDYEEGFFPSGKERLYYWFVKNPLSHKVILFFHGNAGNLSNRVGLIQALYDAGFSVFAFDYRGYGKSSGRPSEAGLYEDGRCAYDFLAVHKGVLSEDIILYGRSLGGAVAVNTALGMDKGRLVVDAAFTDLKSVAKRLYPYLPVGFLLKYRFDNLSKIRAIKIPVLFVYSREDELIPISMGKALFEQCRAEKTIIFLNHGGHNDAFFYDQGRFLKALSDFAH